MSLVSPDLATEVTPGHVLYWVWRSGLSHLNEPRVGTRLAL